MRSFVALISIVFIAACGANGEPVRPSVNTGVTVSNSGISTNVSTGVKLGGVDLSLGLGL